jgi:hypothetical protein
MFVLIFVILIVMSAAIFEKSHYDNENQRLFCRKIEIRSATNGSRCCYAHEGAKLYVQEKVDNWKSTVNRRYRRMD